MQKTNFPIEIIIHDDASTDGTTEIVKEYARKHPDIIVPIFQKENQYSKGIKLLPTYVYSQFRGKYVALCEGDDYWTDPLKLQEQAEVMMRNTQCNISFHPVNKIESSSGTTIGLMGNIYDQERLISAKEILDRGITFMPTCSLMLKSSFLKKPKIHTFLSKHGSSFFLKFLPAIEGGAIFINKIMASYTVLSEGSYTQRAKDDPAFAVKYLHIFNTAFDVSNELTKYHFNNEIERMKIIGAAHVFRRHDISQKDKKDIYLQYLYKHGEKSA